jgi:hypothetical protein
LQLNTTRPPPAAAVPTCSCINAGCDDVDMYPRNLTDILIHMGRATCISPPVHLLLPPPPDAALRACRWRPSSAAPPTREHADGDPHQLPPPPAAAESMQHTRRLRRACSLCSRHSLSAAMSIGGPYMAFSLNQLFDGPTFQNCWSIGHHSSPWNPRALLLGRLTKRTPTHTPVPPNPAVEPLAVSFHSIPSSVMN